MIIMITMIAIIIILIKFTIIFIIILIIIIITIILIILITVIIIGITITITMIIITTIILINVIIITTRFQSGNLVCISTPHAQLYQAGCEVMLVHHSFGEKKEAAVKVRGRAGFEPQTTDVSHIQRTLAISSAELSHMWI
jgi:hypothetical protein